LERIYLVGFMGVGKSTIGKKLAHQLNYEFIDLDDAFEKKYKIGISNFFRKYDEELFRKMEHELLVETFEKSHVLVSTGGGTPCFFDAMEKINRAGLSIYIKMSPAAIAYRLSAAKRKRPLLEGLSKEELQEFITKKLKKREPVYLQAHIHINGMHVNIDELAEHVQKKMKAV